MLILQLKCGTLLLDSAYRLYKVRIYRLLDQVYLEKFKNNLESGLFYDSPSFLLGPNKHQSAVTCLQFNKKFVITSSDDGTVKIWDLRSGDFLRNLVSLDSGGSGGVVWRVRCSNTKLVCAVGSRNGTEETKLLVLDFDVEDKKT